MNVHEYVITSYLINAFKIVRLAMSKIYTLFRKKNVQYEESSLVDSFSLFFLNITVWSVIQSNNSFPPHIF